MSTPPVERSLEPAKLGLGPLVEKARPALQRLLVLGVVVAVWSPFLRSTQVDNGYADWTWRTDYLGYELNAWRQDHQFPFWVTDPRFEQFRVKGVHDFFANPETDVLSIVPLLAALTNYLTAVKLALLACLALGVYGYWRLLRTLSGRAALLPTLFTALLALCNGALTAHLLIGHTNIIAFASFPLALALLVEAYDPRWTALDRARRAALAGALLAAAYYSGCTHYLFHFLLAFVGLLPLLTLVERPRAWRASLGSAAVAGLSFIALSAFKLLPGIDDFGHYHTNYLMTFRGLGEAFGYLLKPYSVTGIELSHEYLMYVGWGGVALLAVGLLGLRDRRLRPLLLAVLLLAPIMFLHEGSRLLELPFLKTQGALTRFRLQILLAAAVASGFQLARLDAWLARRRRPWLGRGVLAALALLFALDLARTNVAREVHDACRAPLPVAAGPFDQAPAFRAGPGVLGTVVPSSVQANAFSYRYALRAPGLLVATGLPATPRPHLAIEGDGELTQLGAQLAVRVPVAAGSFRLRFSDPAVDWGLVISIAAALAVAALAWRGRPSGAGAAAATP